MRTRRDWPPLDGRKSNTINDSASPTRTGEGQLHKCVAVHDDCPQPIASTTYLTGLRLQRGLWCKLERGKSTVSPVHEGVQFAPPRQLATSSSLPPAPSPKSFFLALRSFRSAIWRVRPQAFRQGLGTAARAHIYGSRSGKPCYRCTALDALAAPPLSGPSYERCFSTVLDICAGVLGEENRYPEQVHALFLPFHHSGSEFDFYSSDSFGAGVRNRAFRPVAARLDVIRRENLK